MVAAILRTAPSLQGDAPRDPGYIPANQQHRPATPPGYRTAEPPDEVLRRRPIHVRGNMGWLKKGRFKELLFVLFSLEGRMTRSQFWPAWVLVLLLGIGLNEARDNTGTLLLSLAYGYLSITIYGKRLHDIGKSAWSLAWPFLIHGVAMGIGAYLVSQVMSGALQFAQLQTAAFISTFVPFVVWLIVALVVGIPRGEDRDNRFGRNPRVQAFRADTPDPFRPRRPVSLVLRDDAMQQREDCSVLVQETYGEATARRMLH